MKVVKVYGALKERLGRGTFEFAVNTPAQAIKALCVNFPGLEKWFIDNDQNGIAYKVKVGKEEVGEDNLEVLSYPWSEREVFSIAPVVTGAGRGWGQVLLGAVLIGASFMFPGAGMFGTTSIFGAQAVAGGSIMTSLGTMISAVGASLVLNGIAEIISPTPPSPRDPKKNENFGFGGVENTTSQGTPVPICYGRLFIGSAAISVSLDTNEVVTDEAET